MTITINELLKHGKLIVGHKESQTYGCVDAVERDGDGEVYLLVSNAGMEAVIPTKESFIILPWTPGNDLPIGEKVEVLIYFHELSTPMRGIALLAAEGAKIAVHPTMESKESVEFQDGVAQILAWRHVPEAE